MHMVIEGLYLEPYGLLYLFKDLPKRTYTLCLERDQFKKSYK